MAIKIIIYEDNERLRGSLELLLNEEKSYEVCGSYPDCDNVATDVAELKPDIVIMDIDMPGIGGLEGIKILKSTAPDVKVIVHTVFDDDNRIFDSICAGADGYMLKNTSPAKLIYALQELMENGSPMSPFVAQKVFQYFKDKGVINNSFDLTGRELEILHELVNGNSYKMIADILNIKVDTVRKHLQNIYHKLHVNTGTEAVVKAIQQKIVTLD